MQCEYCGGTGTITVRPGLVHVCTECSGWGKTDPIERKHTGIADEAIAVLMNCLDEGEVELNSNAYPALKAAINTYLMERGFSPLQLPDLWSGEIQLTCS